MRRVDWAAFCKAYGVPMKGVRRGMWLEVRCPFCGDRKYKGAVNIRSGAYHCWKCGSHGIFDFVSASSGCGTDAKEVYRALDPYRIDGGSVMDVVRDDGREREQGIIRKEMMKRERGLPVPGSPVVSKAMKRYLRGRGFNANYLIDRYDLRDGGIYGEWAYRIIIPIYVDGKVVSWQGRHIGDNPMRYKAASLAESLDIKEELYNLDNCRRRRVIVVEGIFDCWRLGDDCCAVFGISVMDAQIMKLAERFDEIYFLFDPEEKARRMAEECARKVDMLGKKAYVLDMSDTESGDPGELTAEEVVQVKKLVFGDVPGYDYDTPWLRRCKNQACY